MAEEEEGFIKPEEYQREWQNFYRPINIKAASTSATSSALPSLASQSGIQVSVDKPNMDTRINKINNTDEDVSDHFNIFSLKNSFKTGTKLNENSYQNMMDAIDGGGETKDKNDWLGKFGTLPLNVAGAFGMALGGKKGFGASLVSPTGSQIFSVGKISEVANKNHYTNFLNSQQSYEDMSKQGKTHFNFDTGFAAKIGNHHFSRSANANRFEGNLTALHSDSHTAHMMLKSMDAMSKGLDPRGSGAFSGYRLDGQNEGNRGMSDAMLSNGMGGISNDGYYTYVSGADLGHTKSRLYKNGNISKQLASGLKEKGYNIDGNTLVKLMEEARKGDKSFTELLSAYKTSKTGTNNIPDELSWGEAPFTSAGFTSNITNVGDNWNESGSTFGKDTSQIRDWTTTPDVPAGAAPIPPTLPAGFTAQDSFTTGVGYGESYRPMYKNTQFSPNYQGRPVDIAGQGRTFKQVGSVDDFKGRVKDSFSGDVGKDLTAQAEEEARMAASRAFAAKHLQDERDRREQERAERTARVGSDVNRDFTRDSSGRKNFNIGGQVSSPVGQLANMLRSKRLGYNQGGAVQSGYYGYQEGGQINMQEMGFVNGKTPDQITDAQSVADTEAMSADEGDFVINAPAVEAVGVEAIVGLVSDALTLAAEEGVEIVDIPQDTSPEVMVDILVSEGEFIIPRELIPFVDGGIETLEKINALGTDEVSQRVEEGGFNEEAMMEQMGALEAPPEEPLPEEIPPQEIPEIPDVPMRYGDIVRRIIPSTGFI